MISVDRDDGPGLEIIKTHVNFAHPTSILQLGYNFTPVIFIYLNNLNILSTMRENRKIIDLLQKYLLVIFSLNTYLQYDGKCNFDIFYFEKYLQFYNKIPHCL